METLALPLRILPDGGLEKTDPVSSVISVIEAMASSPASTWAHAPWFGLADLFGQVNPQREDHPALGDALNRGLAELGVVWIWVTGVRLLKPGQGRPESPGIYQFELTMMTNDGTAVRRTITP